MVKVMNLKEAKDITGGLSNPSKMPGYGYNLPAKNCRTGAMLRNVEGSVCSQCYARKGRYVFTSVQAAMRKRRRAIDDPRWVEAMSVLIDHYCKKVPYFRFHDSGDLQSIFHLNKIVKIVKKLPNVKFWLPTLEIRLIKYYFFGDVHEDIPDNLNIRLSTAMINKFPSSRLIDEYGGDAVTTSSVHTDVDKYPKIILCHATVDAHECGDCRKCWDKSFKHVIYVKH